MKNRHTLQYVGGTRPHGISLLIIFSLLSLMGCNMNSSGNNQIDELRSASVSDSISELSKYIVTPPGLASTTTELVTLPESEVSDIPGPTDYAAVVARLVFKTPQELQSALSLLQKTQPEDFPKNFVRSWMNKAEQNALGEIINKSSLPIAENIASWSKQKSIYAVAKQTDDRTMVAFICLLSP